MALPSVSVIIPTFNRHTFLIDAITSVREQSFASWELIIVDDGSTDGTRAACAQFDDPRIRYHAQSQRGVAAARNQGVALSIAPWIAFLDSDDLWLPQKLERQLQFLKVHPHLALCQTEEIWMRRGKRVNPRTMHQKRSGWIFPECLPLCIISPSAVMLRREAFGALGGFDEALPACEDYDLWLRATLRYEVQTMQEPLIIKRGGHADQLSRGWGLDRYRIVALEKTLQDPALPDEMRLLVISQIQRRSRIVALGARKRGNDDLARIYEEKLRIADQVLEAESQGIQSFRDPV